MGINLAGGYAAGGINDVIFELTKERMLQQAQADAERERQFQRSRDVKADTRAEESIAYTKTRNSEQDAREAAALKRQLAQDQLTLMEGQKGTDLVPQEKWKMQATTGLPPSLGGQEPQRPLWGVNPQDVPSVEVPGVGSRRPRTKEEIDAEKKRLLDEASQRNINENAARAQPPNRTDIGGYVGPKGFTIQRDDIGGLWEGPTRITPDQVRRQDPQPTQVLIPVKTVDEKGNQVTTYQPPSAVKGRSFLDQPTDAQQEAKDALARVKPVFAGVVELADKINKQQGLMATISGSVEQAKAKVNLDNDVAEYQSLISMFSPLLARAVGHRGVLTQLDVESVIAGLPKPTDSLDLKERKINRVAGIMGWDVNAVREFANTVGAGGPPAGGGGPNLGDVVGNFIVVDPKGKKHGFNTQAEADTFKKNAGIK